MTTASHLHFEVWQNKSSVDPLRFLSLASLDFNSLATRYDDKFISDIIEKSGSGADTSKYPRKFIISGTTETARQMDLLKKYATPDFNSWDMWVNESLSENIDPSFLMCVGLAETTLGNHLKTPYNVGNIGNTDDGSTSQFASPSDGVAWMARTLNNKFLGKYTKVSELSRW